MSDVLRRQLLPVVATLEAMADHEVHMVLGSDSAASIAAVKKGTSVALKHVRKNHRVSLASVHDSCSGPRRHLVKVDTHVNCSDICTKALDSVKFAALRALLGVFCPTSVPELPAAGVLHELALGSLGEFFE